MPERDGKDQREDSPKQACSCWFARHGCLATSSADLYPPGVWLRGVISFFCGVTFVMFLFRFRLLVFIKAAAFNFFSICIALTVTRSYLTTVGVLFYFVYIFFLGGVAFPDFSVPCCRFLFWMESSLFSFLPDGVCYLMTTGWILTSHQVRIQSTNQPRSVTARVALLPCPVSSTNEGPRKYNEAGPKMFTVALEREAKLGGWGHNDVREAITSSTFPER